MIAEREREQLHRQVLSSVSHDLKTPLASIIGSLEVYERMSARLTAEQKKSLITVALEEAYRLDNFITNILDMAKLENGLVPLRHEAITLSGMLDDCVTRLGHCLKDTKLNIDTPDRTLQVQTDPTLISRATVLLLENAVKYGGVPSIIHIASGSEGAGQGFIRITDNGQGIPPDRMEAIFSKYTRFARGDQQNAGTGLGLSICREIMRLLKGTVTVANSAAGGAEFTLHFPLT